MPSHNLVPRALFPGFGAPKAREKRPGDEVGPLTLSLSSVFGRRA